MNALIRKYTVNDIPQMIDIWNEVVESGIAFPQTDALTAQNADALFSEQSFTGVAYGEGTGEILGLYILHPNNIGRCGHIANASYAVKSAARGLHIGEELVRHSLQKGKELGFRVLQFNAVVKTNFGAIHLYEKLGFVQIGVVPGGFLMKDGRYEDIVLFYRTL